MREILFRGKRVDNGEWHEGLLIYNLEEYAVISKQKRNEQHPGLVDCMTEEVIPATVGQYTGLTDLNGNRIFEGDIVNILTEVDEIGVIEWADTEAMFRIEEDVWSADFDNYLGIDFEVIGNIHDNPELLSGVI